MPRIQPLDPDQTTGKSKELVDAVQQKLGSVPNLLKTMAHSPATLQTYLSINQALDENAQLPKGLREQIALTVAGVNQCGYCASAHTAIAKSAGVSEDDAQQALHGNAPDPRTDAILDFASRVVETRGWVNDQDFQNARDAGVSDPEILEIITVVVANILTNYLNHAISTEIDFPRVELPQTAGA